MCSLGQNKAHVEIRSNLIQNGQLAAILNFHVRNLVRQITGAMWLRFIHMLHMPSLGHNKGQVRN